MFSSKRLCRSQSAQNISSLQRKCEWPDAFADVHSSNWCCYLMYDGYSPQQYIQGAALTNQHPEPWKCTLESGSRHLSTGPPASSPKMINSSLQGFGCQWASYVIPIIGHVPQKGSKTSISGSLPLKWQERKQRIRKAGYLA